MDRLHWHKNNEKHYTGFEDGIPLVWVYWGDDETWWWETDCTDNGLPYQVNGFATAEDAKSAADVAYGEWVGSQGDPLADIEPIAVEDPISIGTPCDICGVCPYGCEIGSARCISCTVFTEDDVANPFDDISWEDEDE